MIEARATLVNPKGLHARASHRLSTLAQSFACDCRLFFHDHQADAKQIMSVMLLAAPVGSELLIRCQGKDEKACLAAMVDMIQTGLGELGERAEH